MTLFCFLWVPLFYLLWHSMFRNNLSSSGVWALFLGGIAALLQFFLDDLINPRGFGLFRWLNAWVDIIVLPAILPIIIYLIIFLISLFRIPSSSADYINFALLWQIPNAALRAVSWSSSGDPIFLVLVPVLWTSLICGIFLFIDLIKAFPRWYIITASVLGIIILPFTAATTWWAFYSQRTSQALPLLIFTLSPFFVYMIFAWLRTSRN